LRDIAGRYRVVRKLGRGQSGEVFSVCDTTTNSTLALKLSFPNEDSVRHLENEFFTLGELDHPNIVRAFDFGRATDRRAYFTMSYVKGKRFTQHKFNSRQKFYEAIARILSALQYIHARGLIHCDLKPENILVKRGNPILLDFGLAVEPDESTKARGSIHYIAPELFRGARPDPRADLYSLGVILYQALMHRLPFDGNSVSELMVSHVRSKPLPIRKRSVDRRLAEMVMRLVEVDPEYRHECSEEVLEELQVFLPESASLPGGSGFGYVFTSPFIGREREVGRLETRIRECIRGTSQFIFIAGQEGMGKSRLAGEIRRKAQVNGFRTETIACAKEGAAQLMEDLPRRGPSLVIFEDAHLIEPREVGDLSRLLREHSDKPVIFIVTSETGMRYTQMRERLSSVAPWTQILLKRLSEEETLRMVEGMLIRTGDSREIGAVVYRLSGGIPLLIEDAVRNLVSSGALRKKRRSWHLKADIELSVPLTGKWSWIAARQVKSLREEEAQILEITSLLDEETSEAFLERMGVGSLEYRRALVSLASRGLVDRIAGRKFRIASGYLSSYLRSRIPSRRKRNLHRQIGETFSQDLPALSAKHFMLAGERTRAFRTAMEEATRLDVAEELERACECYEMALKTCSDPAKTFEILSRLTYLYDALSEHGKALGAAREAWEIGRQVGMDTEELRVKAANIHIKKKEHARAQALLEEVLSTTSDERVKCNALCELAWLMMETNQNSEALRIAKNAREIAERKEDEPLMAKVYHTLGTIRWNSGKLDASEKLMKRAVELKVKLGLHSSAADSLNNLGVICWSMGDMGGAERAYRRALDEFVKAGDRGGIGGIYANIGLVEWSKGEWESALADYDRAYLIQEEVGDQAALARLDNLIGVAEENMGNWKKALVHFKRHLRFNQSRKDKKGVAVSLNSLGSLLLKTGALEESRDAFDKCLRLRREIEDLEGEGLCLLNLAMVKKESGETEGALKDIERSIRICRRAGIEKDLGTAYRVKAEILLEMGRASGAERAATGALNMSRKTKDRLELSHILRVQAALPGAVSEEKEKLHQRSIEIARALDARYELGRGLLGYGRFLLGEDGRLSEAVERLRDATAIFERLGAERDLRAARAACSEAVARIASMKGFGAGMLQVSALNEIAGLIGSIGDIREFYQKVVNTMVGLLGAERGMLLLFPGDAEELEVAAQSSMDRATMKDATALSRGVVNEAAGRGVPVICDDAFTDPRFNQNRSVVLNNIHSLLCVPLKLREEVLGTLYVDSRLDRRLFSKDDIPFVSTLANMMAMAIDNARYHDQIMRENVQLRSEVAGKYGPGNIIGRSPLMREIYKTVKRVALTDSTVLIEGETGTGKELVARAIHYQSKRVAKRFLTIDCGALPESLLESEIFGHQKGSFTGAVYNKKGLFEVGDGGTVFLDEIGDAPQSVQSRLLRVLERSEVRRIGESDYRKVDVRIVCATNKHLAAEVEKGRFRKDLYFRLKVFSIETPALRERREDILLLANHFVERMKKELGKEIEGIAPDAARTLIAYPWPGNVRELQNEIARACTLVPESCSISKQDLSPVLRGESVAEDERYSLARMLGGIEKRIIAESLRRNRWNKTRAANELGLSRQGLLKKMTRHGISGKKTKQQV
jgi:Nif-specific regulatory protein